jgi:MFS family permease
LIPDERPRPPDTDRPGLRERAARLAVDTTPLRTSLDFRRLWLAQAASFIGSEVAFVALAYQVYALTNSTLAVGLLALVELIPLLTLTLVGGALADAVDRRRLMLWQQVGMTVASAGLLANALAPEPQVWACFVCALIAASTFSFGVGAQNSMLPRLVPEEQIPAASNLDSLVSNLGAVAGPALAGVIIGVSSVSVAYAIDVATFAAPLLALRLLPPIEPAPDADRPSLRSIVDGFRYVRRQPVILGFFLVDTNAMVFGMPSALFPALATHRFGNPALLGFLYAATYGGALLASVFGGWVNRVRRQGLAVAVAAAAWGAAIAAFGFAHELWLAMLLLAMAGAADLVSAVFRQTMLMTLTPDSLRGRLSGIEFMQVASAPALGNLEAGVVASLTSLRFAVVSGGVLCVAGTVLLAMLFPALIRYDAKARAAAAA